MTGHKTKAVQFLFMAFAVALLLISGLTSFSFFYTHFSSLVPAGLIESDVAKIVSGAIGMLLFDVAAAIWLFTFLYHSETSEQRAISLVMTVIAFLGGATASVAYLGLNATGDMQLAEATRQTIGVGSLVIVIMGIVFNFAASLAHNRYSLESKQRVREADRRDTIQTAEENQAKYLDQLIAKEVQTLLTDVAPDLARQQAAKLARQFYGTEVSKYHDGGSDGGDQSLADKIINDVIAKRQAESQYIDDQTGEPVDPSSLEIFDSNGNPTIGVDTLTNSNLENEPTANFQ